MGVADWSIVPAENASADPLIPAQQNAAARDYIDAIHGVMAGVAAFAATTPSIGHTLVADSDYQGFASDVQIGMSPLTAPRTIYLPDVDTYPLGQVLFVADESGSCSEATPITIAVKPGSGDSIAGQPSLQLINPYQGLGFRRGAANLWIRAA